MELLWRHHTPLESSQDCWWMCPLESLGLLFSHLRCRIVDRKKKVYPVNQLHLIFFSENSHMFWYFQSSEFRHKLLEGHRQLHGLLGNWHCCGWGTGLISNCAHWHLLVSLFSTITFFLMLHSQWSTCFPGFVCLLVWLVGCCCFILKTFSSS